MEELAAVRQARELSYDDRAAYWEGEARNNAARADRCLQRGEPQAATVFDEYAKSARQRALSERQHWIAAVLGRAIQRMHDPDPGLATELSAVAEWLRETL